MRRAITIRPARQQEAAALRALQERSLRELGAPFYDAEAIEAFLAQGTLPEELIGEGRFLVAEAEGQLLGCGGWSIRTPRYAPLLRDPRCAVPPVVRAVHVQPEAARQGIGRALMQRIEQAMAAAGFATASLIATLPGLPLYRRLGWREAEEVTIRLPCGTTLAAVAMLKALDAAGGLAA